MMAVCAPFNPAGPYVSGLLSYIDCQSVALAQQGYRALGAGSTFAAALDGLLVIAVAMAGYRMLMGGPYLLRDAVYLILRIGFVMALALQWSAYQPLVYNVAARGPQELLGTVFPVAGTTADGNAGVIGRVQAVDVGIAAVLRADEAVANAGGAGVPSGQADTGPRALNVQTQFGQIPELAPDVRETRVSAESLLEMSVVAAFATLKIVIGLMLALGPVFIAAALFDFSRGLFVGWLRVVLGTMIASIALPVVIAFELAVLEPQVGALQRLFETGQALGPLPGRLWVTIALFAVVMLAAVLAAIWSASALRFPDALRSEYIRANAMHHVVCVKDGPIAAAQSVPAAERTHTQKIADAALAAERRDQAEDRQLQVLRIAGPRDQASTQRSEPVLQTPMGIVSRDVVRRRSAAAGRRDMA